MMTFGAAQIGNGRVLLDPYAPVLDESGAEIGWCDSCGAECAVDALGASSGRCESCGWTDDDYANLPDDESEQVDLTDFDDDGWIPDPVDIAGRVAAGLPLTSLQSRVEAQASRAIPVGPFEVLALVECGTPDPTPALPAENMLVDHGPWSGYRSPQDSVSWLFMLLGYRGIGASCDFTDIIPDEVRREAILAISADDFGCCGGSAAALPAEIPDHYADTMPLCPGIRGRWSLPQSLVAPIEQELVDALWERFGAMWARQGLAALADTLPVMPGAIELPACPMGEWGPVSGDTRFLGLWESENYKALHLWRFSFPAQPFVVRWESPDGDSGLIGIELYRWLVAFRASRVGGAS